MDMTSRRHFALTTGAAELREDEVKAGWHFCPDWDGLCVGPGMVEIDGCACGVFDDEPIPYLITEAGRKAVGGGE